MKLEELERRIDQLILKGKSVKLIRANDYQSYADAGDFAGFRAASLSTIERLFGSHHVYWNEFNEATSDTWNTNLYSGINILESIKDEIRGGWLVSVKGLVSAEVFSDFLDMAKHLLDEGYKDAAAVMIGSVLEEHLRNLCGKYSIEVETEKEDRMVPKKSDQLNSELAKANAYGKLEQKNITAWLDLRNKAAHGKYSDYEKSQVDLMYQGVLDFMTRVPL